MNRRYVFWFLMLLCCVLLPLRAPAPLIYVPGEGWYYETYGSSNKWQRKRAKDQLDVAEQAFNNGDYKLTLHAAHRVLRVWPLSDYAPRAQYLVGRALEATGKDEAAFNAYQNIIKNYPKAANYDEILWREYEIANRFLGGEWFRLWGYIPLYPSMGETAKLYGKIVSNGPYSDVAPHAQLRVGVAREKAKDYEDAVKAYETAADRYHDQPTIAADALYRQGASYEKMAAKAEYDQSTAQKAIESYTDFITLYPDDKRVAEAQKSIDRLKTVQLKGTFMIAQFYEKSRKWAGAVVYYNAVLQLNPDSSYASVARKRIEALKPRLSTIAQ